MTNKQQIELARKHLAVGNRQSYTRLMQSMLRASRSKRTTNQIHKALDQDNMRNEVLDNLLGQEIHKLFNL